MNLFSWTPEAVAQLKQLHAEGLSFLRIAVRIGCGTRNAAIGKSKRLGLTRKVAFWTEEREAQLKQLHAEGWNDKKIGSELETTTKSIQAKAARLGLPRHDGKLRRVEFRKPEKLRRPKDSIRDSLDSLPTYPVPDTAQVGEATLRVLFDDLEPHHCRFPSEESPFTFCGHPVVEGYSYCPDHKRLCYKRVYSSPEIGEAERLRRRIQAYELLKRKTGSTGSFAKRLKHTECGSAAVSRILWGD